MKKLTARQKLDDAIRYGQLQLAVYILGYAHIGHITGAYCVTELNGSMFVVRIRKEGPYCITCKSDKDDHASLVRLYLARLGDSK
jgi:hypothetical protein